MLKQLKTVLLTAGFLLYILTGCKKELNTSSLNETGKSTTTKSAERSAIITDPLSSGQVSSRPPIPTQLSANLQSLTQFLNQHSEYRNLLQKLASADEPACNDLTVFYQWIIDQHGDWPDDFFQFLDNFGLNYFSFYYPYFYVNTQDKEYFGINGEYSQRVYKTFKDLKRFWNINSDDMIVLAAHGSVLTNKEIVARIYMDLFGVPAGQVGALADYVTAVINYYPQFRKGNHPHFTFNALALQGGFTGPAGFVPPKIILGDGFLDDLAGIGYGDVGPQAVLAHEYGHQVQFAINIDFNVITPEATARRELMADAYAAYYLSHASGAAMQWKRVKEFLQVFYGIGDCAFTDPDHHGTPNQRMAAAEWAYNLANNARPQGSIITGEQFAVLFDAALPGILLH